MSNAPSNPEPSGILISPVEPGPLPSAWQPVTPRGVAAFASARIRRLLWAQFVIAALVTGAVCWFFATAWFPTLKRAIRQLPDTGEITNSVLISPRAASQILAHGRFIAFILDLEGKTGMEAQTDLLVTLRRRDIRVCSLLGCASKGYEPHWRIPLNRVELEAALGAWRSALFTVFAVGVIGALYAIWFALALLASPLVRLYAFFKDRQVTLLGSWKLASAAWLPGALVLAGLIVLYGLQCIDLLRFLIGWCLHLFVGAAYLVTAPLRLPKVEETVAGTQNPFASSPDGTPKAPP